MTDAQLLAFVLIAYYLWDCLLWVPPRTTVLVKAGKAWRISRPLELLKRRHLEMHLLPILPPAGRVQTATHPSLSFSIEGVVAYTPQAPNPGNRPGQSGAFIRWDDIGSIHAKGREIHVNGLLFYKAACSVEALFTARWMQGIRKTVKGSREEVIDDYLREVFRDKAARERLEATRRPLKTMGSLSLLLFLWIFVAIPVAHWKWGLENAWIPLLSTMLLLMWTQAILFQRAHKKAFPEADEERFVGFLSALLTPPGAIRIPDRFAREILVFLHPVQVMNLLMTREDARSHIHAVMRDLEHPIAPLCPLEDPSTCETVASFRQALRRHLVRHLAKKDWKESDWQAMPEATEPVHLSYCPRCVAQYIHKEGKCEDCGGLELRPLKEETKD